jgi:hypothetical protein
VRVSPVLPTTATSKILVRQLRMEGLDCGDPVYEIRSDGTLAYAPRVQAEASP